MNGGHTHRLQVDIPMHAYGKRQVQQLHQTCRFNYSSSHK